MATIWVTGGAGMLGSWLAEIHPARHRVVATSRADVELSDTEAVRAFTRSLEPDLVIHTAYGTADLDRDVRTATASVAAACRDTDTELLHLSTDVVFDGRGGPYGENAPLSPVHAYGRAKADAERLVTEAVPDAAIVRTSLICWNDPLDPRSQAVVDALDAGPPPTMFIDELRNPVRVDDLAATIWALVDVPRGPRAGMWHVVGAEPFSRHALAELVAHHAGRDAGQLPIVSADTWQGAEPRPRDCRLLTTRGLPGPLPRSVRTLFE